MRILVTGGAGFVGSNLCATLLEEGHVVLCLDNFFTGRRENIQPLLSEYSTRAGEGGDGSGKQEGDGELKFQVVEHDVRFMFPESVIGRVDRIYHLACPASPPHYQKDPIFTLQTSVNGAINALSYAHREKTEFGRTCRVLFSSTSEVYGDPLVHPQVESYRGNVNCTGPRACYDEGKRAAESAFFDFHRTYGLEVRVARIFNTYGPLMDPKDGRVVSNFVVQALQGLPLTIYGDGSQTRSFCYVSDLVRGLILLMEGPDIGPINLGNPGEYTIGDMAKVTLDAVSEFLAAQSHPEDHSGTSSESSVVYHEIPVDDPKVRRPDISKAKLLLGWEPKVPFEEGLKHTVKYFYEEVLKLKRD
eukprot:TRINITY_DN80570_c0_g1_i1.p1 TRINITY_DN80570_c0_g1~~TRINITY_DN80570_c0_g1_i1.p1  ORF type:complete len:360 (-),score=84.49 TRINITY_DN80570_c0_g1_i1:281-1360(-)